MRRSAFTLILFPLIISVAFAIGVTIQGKDLNVYEGNIFVYNGSIIGSPQTVIRNNLQVEENITTTNLFTTGLRANMGTFVSGLYVSYIPGECNVLGTDSSGLITCNTVTSFVTGSGTANYIPKWTGTSTLGNSIIVESGGNIGIGTEAPDATLDVNGGAIIRGGLNMANTNIFNANSVQINDVGVNKGFLFPGVGGISVWTTTQGGENAFVFQTTSTYPFKFKVGSSDVLTVTSSSVSSSLPFYYPVFYDRDNNAYYVNPAENSELNIVSIVSGTVGFLSVYYNMYAPAMYDRDSNSFFIDPDQISVLQDLNVVGLLNGGVPITSKNIGSYAVTSITAGAGLTGGGGPGSVSLALAYPSLSCSGDNAIQAFDLSTGGVTCLAVDTSTTNEIQNIFQNVSDGANVATADSPTDTLYIQGGPGISVSVDSATDTVTITNTGDTNPSDDVTAGTVSANYVTKWSGTGNEITSSQIYDNGTNVGIGTSTPTARLEVNGGVVATYVNESLHDDVYSYGSLGALEARIALYATTIEYGTVEPDTRIYVNGRLVVYAPNPSVGTFTVSAGDIITSNKPIGLIDSTRGLPIPPISAAGTKFVFYTNRNAPHTVYIYSPYAPAYVEYYLNRYPDGNPDQNILVQPGQVATMTLSTDGVHRFVSTAPIIMVKLGAAGDYMFVPPASREVIHTMSDFRYTVDGGTITCYGGTIFCVSDTPMSSTQIADGSGYDAEMGLPYRMLGDTYIVTHPVADFAIAAVEPTIVRVYYYSGGQWVLYNEYNLLSASRSNPVEIEVGDQSGAGTPFITSTPILFVGTAPFYLRTNDPSNDDEYSVIGYRQSMRNLLYPSVSGESSQYWTSSGYELYPVSTDYNVGIGTTTPSYKLDVSGTTRTSSLLVTSYANVGGTVYADTVDAGQYLVSGTTVITADRNITNINSITAAGPMNIDSGTLYVDSANNRIGIGTTSPTTFFTAQNAYSIDLYSTWFALRASGTNKYLGLGYDSTNDYGFIRSWEAGIGDMKLLIEANPLSIKAHVYPSASNTYDLGSTAYKWRNAYIAGTTYTNSIRWGNNSLISGDQGGSIELGGDNSTAGTGTPYIDFHYSGSLADYDVRLRIVGTDTLAVEGGTLRLTTLLSCSKLYTDASGNIVCGTDQVGITGSGDLNYIPKWTGSTTIGNSQIYDNGTNVGIGTTSPTARLDVAGDIKTSNKVYSSNWYVSNNAGQGQLWLYNSSSTDEARISRWTDRLEIMSSDAIGFSIGAVGSTKMWLDSSGHLGIGTTSPKYWLDVRKTGTYVFRIGGANGNDLTFDIAAGAGLANITAGAEWNGSTYVYTGTRGASRIELHDGTFYLYVGGISGTAGSPVSWKTVMQGTSAGNAYFPNSVGIGTSSPGAKLHVYGIGVVTLFGNPGSGYSALRFVGSNSDDYAYIQAGTSSTDTTAKLRISRYSTTTSTLNRLEIYSDTTYISGNVGIGVASPSYKLDVSGQVNAQGYCINGDCITSWSDVGAAQWSKTTVDTSYTVLAPTDTTVEGICIDASCNARMYYDSTQGALVIRVG